MHLALMPNVKLASESREIHLLCFLLACYQLEISLLV